MHRYDTFIRTGSALRQLGGMPVMALVVLGLTTASALSPRATAGPTITETIEPGAIGTDRRPQFGPRPDEVLSAHHQPVELRGPKGLELSIQTTAGWSVAQPLPVRVGLLPGRAYRLKLTRIPGQPAEVLYPSLRVLAPLVAPAGQRWRFPIEMVIDRDDLDEATAGNHVQRVVYLSNEPEVADVLASRWFDVRPGDDPIEVAQTLGEPIAELRIGNRLPLLPRGILP